MYRYVAPASPQVQYLVHMQSCLQYMYSAYSLLYFCFSPTITITALPLLFPVLLALVLVVGLFLSALFPFLFKDHEFITAAGRFRAVMHKLNVQWIVLHQC